MPNFGAAKYPGVCIQCNEKYPAGTDTFYRKDDSTGKWVRWHRPACPGTGGGFAPASELPGASLAMAAAGGPSSPGGGARGGSFSGRTEGGPLCTIAYERTFPTARGTQRIELRASARVNEVLDNSALALTWSLMVGEATRKMEQLQTVEEELAVQRLAKAIEETKP